MRLDCTDIVGGAILADARLAPESNWFEPAHWRRCGAAEPVGKGRGEAVTAGESGCWVLRHYRRGGLPGRLVEDQYAWRGLEASRPIRELRLLAELLERGAPVAPPVAARVLRSGLLYRGDILTERIGHSRTLAESAGKMGPDEWREVGDAIRRFHAAGGWHADLNARNILLAPAGVFLVDLDRGRLVKPAHPSQRRNLDRLERSLRKLEWLPGVAPGWRALLDVARASPPA